MSFSTIATSPDGVTWTNRPNDWSVDDQHALVDVDTDGTTLVVVAWNIENPPDMVGTSTDGINWTQQSSPWDNGSNFLAQGFGVAYSPALGQWCAVGYGPGPSSPNGANFPAVMTSPDGITWTGRATPGDRPGGTAPWFAEDVAWSPTLGLWVVVGDTSSLHPTDKAAIYSSDGITWTFAATLAAQDLFNVVWGGGQFIATGRDASGHGQAYSSTDGINWSLIAGIPNGAGGVYTLLGDLAYNGSLWVMSRSINSTYPHAVITSPDGVTWTSQTTPDDYVSLSLGYANVVAWSSDLSQWLVSGQGNGSPSTITGNAAGTSWTSQSTPFDAGAGAASGAVWHHGLGLWVMVGYPGTIPDAGEPWSVGKIGF